MGVSLIDQNAQKRRQQLLAGFQNATGAPVMQPNFEQTNVPEFSYSPPGGETQHYTQQENGDYSLDSRQHDTTDFPRPGSNTGIVGPVYGAQQSLNPEQAFWQIFGGLPPSAKNLEDNFSKYQAMVPGATMKRNASGYVDSIYVPGIGYVDTQRNSGYDRSDAWQWNVDNGGGGIPGVGMSSYTAQFDDPSTRQYEQQLMGRINELSMGVDDQARAQYRTILQNIIDQQTAQQAQLTAANQQAQQRRQMALTASDAATANANAQAQRLKQPAYTDSEANILRTQVLDPLERDRAASQKRALERISARGLTPESGIAAELQRGVDQVYDEGRTRADADVAYRQITEQRSREQEAQQLLNMVAQMQNAAVNGDLDLVNYYNSLVNQRGAMAAQAGTGQVALNQGERDEEAARRAELLGLSQNLYNLPRQAQADATAAMSGFSNPASLVNQYMQLAGLQQQRAGQNANMWANIGATWAPILAGLF